MLQNKSNHSTLKKKRGGKKVKKSFEINPDFVKEYTDTKSLTLEEIDVYIKRLVIEYEKEKENRHVFQLERDKLIEMREIEKRKFQDLKAELLETHEQLKNLQQEHYDMIAALKQKIRYLMSEQQARVNELKFENEKCGNLGMEESLKEKEAYVLQLRQFLTSLHEKENQYEDMIKNLTLEHENRASRMRQQHADELKTVHKTMETRLNDERAQFSLITRNAVHEVTERKNTQINELIKIHNKAYDNLRNYFKELISSSMILVNNLQEKSSKAIVSQNDSISKARQIEKELKVKSGESVKLHTELRTLKQKSDLYEVERKMFQHKDEECKKVKEQLAKLDLKYEMLLANYTDLKKEHDGVLRNVEASSLIFQEKCNNRIFITNRKVEVLEKDLSRYEDFLKAFSFEENNSAAQQLVKDSKFDHHEILHQFRLRENVIDEQNRKIANICDQYNSLFDLIRNSSSETKYLLDNYGFKHINVNSFFNTNFSTPTSSC